MQSSWLRFAMLSTLLALGGCVVANAVVEPYTRLQVDPGVSINPDSNGRPSPLVVRVYELASRTTFNNSDFFSLYDEAMLTLDGDLISMDELVVRPGQPVRQKMRLKQATRYIGIVAAFQDIQNAHWRLVVEASPRGYDTIHVAIDKLTLSQLGE